MKLGTAGTSAQETPLLFLHTTRTATSVREVLLTPNLALPRGAGSRCATESQVLVMDPLPAEPGGSACPHQGVHLSVCISYLCFIVCSVYPIRIWTTKSRAMTKNFVQE
jgi:hypothetical protein